MQLLLHCYFISFLGRQSVNIPVHVGADCRLLAAARACSSISSRGGSKRRSQTDESDDTTGLCARKGLTERTSETRSRTAASARRPPRVPDATSGEVEGIPRGRP